MARRLPAPPPTSVRVPDPPEQLPLLPLVLPVLVLLLRLPLFVRGLCFCMSSFCPCYDHKVLVLVLLYLPLVPFLTQAPPAPQASTWA